LHGPDFSYLKKPKYKPKWLGSDGILRNVIDARPTRVLQNKWLLMHPLKLLGAVFSRKKGLPAYIKDKKLVKRAVALRERYKPEFNKVYLEFKNTTSMVLANLEKAVRENRINAENRNRFLASYGNAIARIEDRFRRKCRKLIRAYATEWQAENKKQMRQGEQNFNKVVESIWKKQASQRHRRLQSVRALEESEEARAA